MPPLSGTRYSLWLDEFFLSLSHLPYHRIFNFEGPKFYALWSASSFYVSNQHLQLIVVLVNFGCYIKKKPEQNSLTCRKDYLGLWFQSLVGWLYHCGPWKGKPSHQGRVRDREEGSGDNIHRKLPVVTSGPIISKLILDLALSGNPRDDSKS